jgi:iron complex outermembrane receptor protein
MCARRPGSIFTLAALSLVAGITAAAADESEDRLADIIVTAQKREQNVQDVGTSIEVLSGKDILERGMTNQTDIVEQMPGVEMIQFSPVVVNLSIRGVSQSSYSDHLEAPIAVYVDGAYVAANGAISGSLFDIDRIEVLRGPQGTLFGRNATGGLVQYVTHKPTAEPDAFFSVTGGSFGEGIAQGAVGGPISGDLLGRLSFSYNHFDGYLKDTNGPTTPQQHSYALRAQLAETFGETHVLLSIHDSRDPREAVDSYIGVAAVPNAQGLGAPVGADQNPYGTCPGCNLVGYRYPPAAGYLRTTDGPHDFNRTVRGATLTITSSVLGGATLTSVTDYYRMNKAYAETSDPSPIPVNEYFSDQNFSQFSQETRLDGQTGHLHWDTGLYYLDFHSDNLQVAPTPAFDLGYANSYEQSTRSEAGFGQLEYAFTHQLSATLGGRYSFDQKQIDQVDVDTVTQQTAYIYNPATDPDAHHDFDGFSGKAELDYRPMEDVLLYGSVNRGYKGGNWNIFLYPPFVPSSGLHNAEKLTSYELGEKTTFADGRIRLNADVFYYDYKGYQAYFLQSDVINVFNRNASLYGGELDITAVPVRGLTAQLGYAGLNTNVADVTLPSGEVADRRMPMAPKASVTSLLRYEWPAFDGTLALQGDGKYDSVEYYTTFNAPVERDAAKFVGNVSTSYTHTAGQYTWKATVFVRNVTERLYSLYQADLSSLGYEQYTLAPPRTYGATVSLNFH